MNKTDEELVKLCKQGNNTSFQELMQRYIKPVFNFTYQYVHSTSEAEDITQDTFFKSWKNIQKFKEGKTWKPWIFTIARNTALDYIKKKKPILFSELDNEQDNILFADTLEDTGSLADQIFEDTQNIKELIIATGKLRPEYHSVLMLHYYQELSFEEIATVMNKPMNTVKSWHNRALKIVKKSLESFSAPK